jgi:hypothetical protein
MNLFEYDKDHKNIVTIYMEAAVRHTDPACEYIHELQLVLNRLESEENLVGVVVSPGNAEFYSGASIRDVLTYEMGRIKRSLPRSMDSNSVCAD